MASQFKIIRPTNLKPIPSLHEEKVAAICAKWFRSDISFVRRSAHTTPDIFVARRKQYWEIKNIKGSGNHTIEDNLRKASKQSENIIISLLASPRMDARVAESRIKYILKTKRMLIKHVLLITKDEKVIDIQWNLEYNVSIRKWMHPVLDNRALSFFDIHVSCSFRYFCYHIMMNREKSIVRASFIGIVSNVVLVGLKMLVGVIAGSIAIILDAVNNFTDILSSVVTIIGTKLAARRPDSGHPYGHGRSEYISALVVGIIIFLTGIMSFAESIPKIITPELADYSWATITVVVLAIVVKLALGIYVRRMGHRYDSNSLSASGMDALFDAVLSFATLVGIAVTLIFQVSIDGILGLIISLFIVRTSFEIMLQASDDILGSTADRDLMLKIKRQICTFPDVSGAYDLMLHNYGPTDFIGSVQIQVPDNLTAKDIHRLTREISHRIFIRFGVNLTIGIYAENVDQPEKRKIKDFLLALLNDYPEVRQMHAFYVDDDEKLITFDLVADEHFSEKTKRQIVNAMRREYPGYKYLVTIDYDLEGSE